MLIGHGRWYLRSLGWETRTPRFPFPLINLPPVQAFDFVLPLGKLPESLELPQEAQKLPKGVCSEITQLRNNYCVGLIRECGRRGGGKELVSPEYSSHLQRFEAQQLGLSFPHLDPWWAYQR